MVLDPNSTEDPMKDIMRMIETVYNKACNQRELRCDQRPFHILLMGYGFLVVFLLAMFGNCINLLIYNSDQIRYYIAIRMLCTRLLMNTLAMLFLLPQALRTVGAWEVNSAADAVYWGYYPYQAYFVNVFGFCAMWLTVLMTGECYLHVFFPAHSKSLCTKRNLSKSYVVIGVAGLLLALIYPLNRSVSVVVDSCDRVIIQIISSDSPLMTLIERLHTIANLLFSILIPMSLLVFMTISVVWKLVLRKSEFPNTSHFTSEKRCVTRITLITTSLQLLAELPPIPVFIYAAISGPHVINEIPVCVWNTVGIFLGLCNMSLSFFVYVMLSQKFRQMVYSRLHELSVRFLPCCSTINSKLSYQTEPYGQRTFLNVRKGTGYLTESYLMTERSLSAHEDAFL
ncbi:hypothetical protein RB195_003200 [Necator americanus]|uniref:Uncharacterized protein n=2 Tax=Necator americanus TaxID=51031 RepID=W2TPF5_NECAM|nr:hypothetical protein NECAME_07327 [Necator americanus]ETN83569.1 hypothetical protein NECAME_07327 [Necator americanus]